MFSFKRILSLVLVCAMLMSSVACLGGVFTIGAAAEDAAAYAAAEKASSNEVFSAPHYPSSEEQPSDEGNTLV